MTTYSTKQSPGVVDLGITTGALVITAQTTTTKYRIDQNGLTVMNVRGVADSAIDVIYSTKPDNKLLGVGSITGLNTTTKQKLQM